MASKAFNNESEPDEKQPIFKDLNADQEPEVTEIESLCLQCHKNVRYVFSLLSV